jgi:hypothetical protein
MELARDLAHGNALEEAEAQHLGNATGRVDAHHVDSTLRR